MRMRQKELFKVKRKIKVRFVDFWPGFVPSEWSIYKILSKKYELIEVEKPDYLFDGGMGFHHLKYGNCIKIVKSSENIVPDFNCFDYGMGFYSLAFDDRYIRLPSYAFYKEYKKLHLHNLPNDDALLNRKFCSFVVSNSVGDIMREKFFKRLSQYKRVDSGGKWMNNVGGPVKDKNEFLRGYKFNICFENSSSPGYTTEKLIEALAANTVPIYYGDPYVGKDFNEGCMIRLNSEEDIEKAVEEIVRLDNDDEAYLAKCKTACLVHNDPMYFEDMCAEFLEHIIEQPIEKARRLNTYGYQATQRYYTRPALLLHQYARDTFWFLFDLAHGKIRRVQT